MHPQSLKVGSLTDPQKLGEPSTAKELREIGQAFEWAIDKVHSNNGAVAIECGYTDQGVIGRWISGKERIQLDKLKAHSREVYVELLLTLLSMEPGVEVKTQVTMRRVV